ncbi:MAG: hypothetical protein JO296_13480 [Pseudonocardiales bacterium]|nr:hypothetical protein [Pseudonocardiales bacterium]MBV9651132.1 hypothetical protein [Pseudonocardiales bacterium]
MPHRVQRWQRGRGNPGSAGAGGTASAPDAGGINTHAGSPGNNGISGLPV